MEPLWKKTHDYSIVLPINWMPGLAFVRLKTNLTTKGELPILTILFEIHRAIHQVISALRNICFEDVQLVAQLVYSILVSIIFVHVQSE